MLALADRRADSQSIANVSITAGPLPIVKIYCRLAWAFGIKSLTLIKPRTGTASWQYSASKYGRPDSYVREISQALPGRLGRKLMVISAEWLCAFPAMPRQVISGSGLRKREGPQSALDMGTLAALPEMPREAGWQEPCKTFDPARDLDFRTASRAAALLLSGDAAAN